jgi:glycosyltransferase involved in cell wall biosynthesis
VSEALRVLVIGPGAAGASDALRFEAMIPELARHAIDLVSWTPGDPTVEVDPFGAMEAAVGWSDVLVLRRHYRTWHACYACGFRTLDPAEARVHGGTAEHSVVPAPYFAVRALVGLLEAEPGALGGRSIVYDTDDDIFSADLPPGAEDILERDLVERMLRLADLVTAATPVLAGRLAIRTRAPVRVIRNALDPSWYQAARPAATAEIPGDPRVVYHGATVRLRDYEIARGAVDAVTRDHGTLRRVWLGGDPARLEGVVDEVGPWVRGAREFAAALVAARPDIGLAPLQDTPYNRARSELHWLEYALAGAPAIVTGVDGPGPYDVVRDGVDGFVARSRSDWELHLRSLVASPDLRSELAARARERAMAEYTVATRTPEWVDAYRWAAEHAGLGRARTASGASRAG